MHGLYTLLLNKYYVDEIYAALIVRPLLWISTQRALACRRRRHHRRHGERRRRTSRANRAAKLRKLQSGNARSYATWVIIGAVGFTVLLLGLWMVR